MRIPFLSRLYSHARRLPPEPKRFVKFLIVGSIGFVVDFGTFNLVHFFYNLPNSDTDEVVAQAISFTAAVLSNFAWNYFWIYPEAKTAAQWKKMTKFAVVSVTGLFIRTPVFKSALPVAAKAVTALPLPPLPINLAGNMALVAAVLVVLLWNFFVNRYWTYSDVS